MCPCDDPQGLRCPGPTHSQHRAADLDMLFASGSSILGNFTNHVIPLKSLRPFSFWHCLVTFIVCHSMLTEGVLTVWNGSNLQSWPNFMAMMWLDFKTAPFAQLDKCSHCCFITAAHLGQGHQRLAWPCSSIGAAHQRSASGDTVPWEGEGVGWKVASTVRIHKDTIKPQPRNL